MQKLFARIDKAFMFILVTFCEMFIQFLIVQYGGSVFHCVEGGLSFTQWTLSLIFSSTTFIFSVIIKYIPLDKYIDSPKEYKKVNNEDSYGKENEDDRFYFPNDMTGDFEVFGVNFSKLSPTFKNIVGFGLIILVFICIIMGLRWIQNIRGQTSNNKKKKNKKEKKKQK